MATIETVTYALHVLFAGLWAGGVTFVTVGLLPAARDGDIAPEPFRRALAQLKRLSRTSALILLLTGGHLAATYYGDGRLLGTTNGRLVVAMVVLWLLLAALVEIGSGRMSDDLDAGKIREPARNATAFYRAASAVGVGLLLIGGVLSAGGF